MDGVDIDFKPAALEALAERAISLGTGARALRAEMERLMADIMYEAPGSAKMKKITVTAEMVREKAEK